MSEAELIEHMTRRFLAWRLPDDFCPDAGISFKATFNEHLPSGPMRHEPTGTNLLTYQQARAMVCHLLEGSSYRRSRDAMREAMNIVVCAQGMIRKAIDQAPYKVARNAAASIDGLVDNIAACLDLEIIGHCESCQWPIFDGDECFRFADGPILCEEHMPTPEEARRAYEEQKAAGLIDDDAPDTEDRADG